MNQALLYDFETLSQDTKTTPVLCVSFLPIYNFHDVFFGEHSDKYDFEHFKNQCKIIHFDVDSQIKNYHKIIDKNTVKWWETKVDKKTRDYIFNPPEKHDISELKYFMDELEMQYSDKNCALFSRGQGFDVDIMCNVLKHSVIGETVAFENSQEVNSYFPWWNVRDTRSFIDGLSFGSNLRSSFIPWGYAGLPEKKDKDSLNLHDPSVDVSVEAIRFKYLFDKLHK